MAALQHDSPKSQNFEHKLDDDVDLSHLEKTDGAEGPLEIDPVTDKRGTRKLDKYIIPWLFAISFVDGMQRLVTASITHVLTRLFAFNDRSTIGNAPMDGLTSDLYLDGSKLNAFVS
jgi:hypothetical protein